jgi:hypothetical protein
VAGVDILCDFVDEVAARAGLALVVPEVEVRVLAAAASRAVSGAV